MKNDFSFLAELSDRRSSGGVFVERLSFRVYRSSRSEAAEPSGGIIVEGGVEGLGLLLLIVIAFLQFLELDYWHWRNLPV